MMSAKHRCTVCSRSFVHRETLKEHKLLHGLVILDASRFSCPICQCQVTCQSGVHQHWKNVSSSSTQASESHQATIDNHVSLDEPVSSNGRNNVKACTNAKADGIKLRLKNRKIQCKETVETAAAGTVICKICSRSFVYQKCLQKHTALVHGMSSNNGPNDEVRPQNVDAEDASLRHPSDAGADDEQPEQDDTRESDDYISVCDIQSSVNSLCDDSANGVRKNRKVSAPETPAQKSLGNTVPFTHLRCRLSDLKCAICLKQFKHRGMLMRHMQTVHDEISFDKCTCPLCAQRFDDQLAFSKHFDSEHQIKAAGILSSLTGDQAVLSAADGVGSDVDIVRCEKCSQWFTSRLSYFRHCSVQHQNDVKFTHTRKASLTSLETNHVEQKLASSRYRKYNSSKTLNGKTRRMIKTNGKISDCQNGSSSDKIIHCVSRSERKLDDSQKSSKYLCSMCGKAFITVSFLDRHISTKHRNLSSERRTSGGKSDSKVHKQTFVCGSCSEEFSEESALAVHVELTHKSVTADSGACSCPVCGCSCPNQSLFSMHYDTVHCLDSFLHSSAVVAAQDTTENTVCRCKVCELWFTSEEVLNAHRCSKRMPVKPPPKSGRARYRCMQCGEAFEILRRFLHHRKVKHRVTGPDKTDPNSQPPTDLSIDTAKDNLHGSQAFTSQCARGRPPRSDNSELQTINDDEQKVSDNPPTSDLPSKRSRIQRSVSGVPVGSVGLTCSECSRVFSTIAQLRRHRKSEHRNRTCQLCGETCKSADMVYYHNLKYHHEQKCEVCSASCSGRLGLIEHFRNDHPNEQPPLINRKTLICEYCPRVFAGCASRLLRDHIESCHLGRVHLCDVCGKRLGSAQTLAVHRRMHDPVARFECRECNRRFPHNTNLMNHIRKHHPERLPAKYVRDFRCNICSMQFGSSSGLSRHKSEKHGSQRFQCDLCLRVFPSATGLRLHKRRDHQPKDSTPTSTPVPPSAIHEPVLPPPPPQVVAQFTADPAIMAGFMANMIGLPALGQSFQ